MVLVLVTFLTAACTRTNPVAKSSPTPSPTKLTWTDCGGGFQCTTVEAPLDYAHPDAGTIGIAVSRKPATDLSLIHISEPTRLGMTSYAVFCLKKKKTI